MIIKLVLEGNDYFTALPLATEGVFSCNKKEQQLSCVSVHSFLSTMYQRNHNFTED